MRLVRFRTFSAVFCSRTVCCSLSLSCLSSSNSFTRSSLSSCVFLAASSSALSPRAFLLLSTKDLSKAELSAFMILSSPPFGPNLTKLNRFSGFLPKPMGPSLVKSTFGNLSLMNLFVREIILSFSSSSTKSTSLTVGMESGGVVKEVSSVRGPRSWGRLVLSVIGIDSPPAGVEAAPGSKGCVLSGSGSGGICGNVAQVGVIPGVITIIVIPCVWDERGFLSCWVSWIIATFSHHKYTYEF